MTVRTSFCKATAVALPLGLAATAADAADLLETAQGMDELSTFSEAVAAAGLEQQLEGEGPFTVFAPTNAAFDQLPQSVRDDLLKQEHQSVLAKLLSNHVVEGKAIAAKDVAGREMSVDTGAGDQLTVDGTESVIVVVLASPSGDIATATEGGTQRTEVAEGSDMPVTEHQQEVLESDVSEEARQTAPAGGMPATEHQEEVLAEGERPAAGSDQGGEFMDHASVVEAGVEADNGVIYVIDAVLVPQDTRETLERLKGGA
jgi:uncharacterized surface protein with fasciclin (FAS1) repeats